jgi:hypothetical protein
MDAGRRPALLLLHMHGAIFGKQVFADGNAKIKRASSHTR